MTIVRRILLGLAGSSVLALAAVPANAMPRPQADEWWFAAWGVRSDVWPVTKGQGVTVAVLDTGVNASLPELSGAVLKGDDTTGNRGDGRHDSDEKDGGHGTAMAALIAGQGGGSTDFQGIAPKAKILPVHVTSKLGDPAGLLQAYSAGIRLAVDRGAKVVNLSQGVNSETMPNHCDPRVQQAIAYAIQHDVVVVASAGNEGTGANWPNLPASCAGVLAVGAIDKSLGPWAATQQQSYVAVSAPGVGPMIDKDGRYHPNGWGTSMSAALTSGAVALIRSHNPEMPARTVVQRLITTAHPLGPSKWNNRTGYGAIQITAAMNPERYPVPANAPNPVYEALEKWKASQPVAKEPSTARQGHSSNLPGERAHKGGRVSVTSIAVAGALVVILLVGAIVAIRKRPRGALSVSGTMPWGPGNDRRE
ncbi:S8 family serine peptidase [Actinoallomurus sp. CA-150999]|uniref:S8 family serine peptidase n=1 Tax=Actinoallomurus sp. CA-150999 TaxID=3239887 RepID=UPI003D91A782